MYKETISKKLLISVMLIIVSFFTISSSPVEKKERIKISPFVDEITIQKNQEAWTRIGWEACSVGLVEDYLRSVDLTFTLTYEGEIIQEISGNKSKSNWGEIEIKDDYLSHCFFPTDHSWATFWIVEKLKLNKIGDYEMYYRIELKDAIICGGLDDDGKPAVYEGVEFESTTIIHLVE